MTEKQMWALGLLYSFAAAPFVLVGTAIRSLFCGGKSGAPDAGKSPGASQSSQEQDQQGRP
jgi:hypothetical protein